MSRKNSHHIITRFIGVLLTFFIISQGASINRAHAQLFTSFQTRNNDNYPFISIINASDHSLLIEFTPPEHEINNGSFENQVCQTISMHGLENHLNEDKLFLPFQGLMLGIPQDADLSISILKAEFEAIPGHYSLCPLEKPVFDPILADSQHIDSLPTEHWRYEHQNSFSPNFSAELIETGFIRDQRYAQIRFNPIQYHAGRGELRVYSSIQVEIQFNTRSNQTNPGITPMDDPYFESILSEVLINYDQARHWRKDRQFTSLSVNSLSRSAENAYKISLNQDGIYQITYADFVNAGISPEILDELDPRTFQLINQSKEIAILIQNEQEAQFSPGDALIFYGQKTVTKYTDINVYWLTWGSSFGLRMNIQDVTPTGSALVAENHTAMLQIEQDIEYFSSQSSGTDHDHWYWDYLISTTGNPRSAEFEFILNHKYPLSHTITLSGLLKGYMASPNHRARIYVNTTDQLIADVTFSPGAEHNFIASFPSSYLDEGNNKIIIEANPDGSRSIDFLLINRFELDHLGLYTSENDQILFSESGHWEFNVDGFSTASILTINITNPSQPAILNGGIVESTPDANQIRFETNTTEIHHYMVVSTNQYLSPLSITHSNPADLQSTANAADYIIISHGDFLEQLLPLADMRTSQGYRVQVVDVQDIFDVFNYGIFSPEAIKSFLAYAYTHWTHPAPSFVLLVGDGHYDFKDNLGIGETNFIPPYLDEVDPIIGETATDNRFVSVSGDDILPDLHIGRFPVRSSAEAQVLVQKTINYETNPPGGDWKTALTFVADNADSGGNFPAETNRIISYVTPGYTVERVYLGITHTTATARSDIKAAINAGSLIVHYAGHGSMVQWASEGLLRVSDLPFLTNEEKLPFMLSMTCSEGYFVRPSPPGTNYASLGESIVRMSGGGAIGSWSPTGFGMSIGHMIMEEHLVNNLFNHNHNQVGYLTTQAKYHLYATTSAFRDLIETYVVFGDPALRLNTIPVGLPAPSDLLANSVSTSQIDLTWTDNSSDETAFKIERSHPNMENWEEIGVVAANSLAYSDLGLNPGTTYHYRVRAFRNNDGVFSDYSLPVSVTTINLPAAPTDLVATAISFTEINLIWTDNSDDEAGFEIEHSHTGLDNWTVIGSVSSDVTAYKDSELTPGSTYFYRVRAYLSGIEEYSSYSNISYDTTHHPLKQFYPVFIK